jgi:simple sugar transport system permease protein
MDVLIHVMAAAVRSGTPILYATLGDILTRDQGYRTWGLRGLMLMGAFSGFSVTYSTGDPWLGV